MKANVTKWTALLRQLDQRWVWAMVMISTPSALLVLAASAYMVPPQNEEGEMTLIGMEDARQLGIHIDAREEDGHVFRISLDPDYPAERLSCIESAGLAMADTTKQELIMYIHDVDFVALVAKGAELYRKYEESWEYRLVVRYGEACSEMENDWYVIRF